MFLKQFTNTKNTYEVVNNSSTGPWKKTEKWLFSRDPGMPFQSGKEVTKTLHQDDEHKPFQS